jgi:hypothetical protein
MKTSIKIILLRFSRVVLGVPVIGQMSAFILRIFHLLTFHGSINYWEKRYASKHTSGSGSYGLLSEFKAEILNAFVLENTVSSVIEFGCGDGHQLSLANYPKYIGLDISKTAIQLCKNQFSSDQTKNFFLYDPECFVDNENIFLCDLAISIDVIFHIVEDSIFQYYMKHLFNSSRKFVIIYSSNRADQQIDAHVKNRCFTKWVDNNLSEWELKGFIPNRYPYNNKTLTGSWSDFYIYLRRQTSKH